MAQPITVVRKKPQTFKSTADAEGGAGPAAPVFVAPVHQPSYTGAGVCAILATICLLVVLLLQYLEMDYLKDSMITPIGMVPLTAPAAAPATAPIEEPAAAPSAEPAAAPVAP